MADSAGHAASPVLVDEAFVSALDTISNVDGPTVFHGAGGAPWVIATLKSANALLVIDAATGAHIRTVGTTGSGPGQLRRPNGVSVIGDSVLLVVERDNARVQAFRVPGFEPLGTFGETILRLPYGLTWRAERVNGAETWVVYVTDNYETAEGEVPPDVELGARVKMFRVAVAAGRLAAEHLASFGDTAGPGVLRVVESIMADPAHNRLLIAEELETDSHLKVFDLGGRFTGRLIGRGLFPQQAEGMALYGCRDGAGYWIATDQGDSVNTFHVFDRASLEHVGAFTGPVTRRTDGVGLTQRAFGPFPAGAFYASHLDGAVAAFSWERVAGTLALRSDCGG
jgi:3-phytase